MYHIDVDRSANLVSIKLAGMMTVDEVTCYISDLARRFVEDNITGGYLLMIDTTEAVLQTQDVVTALQLQIERIPKARRIAMVNGSSLAKMQIRRIMTQEYTRVCGTAAEGMTWLLTGRDPIAEQPVAANLAFIK